MFLSLLYTERSAGVPTSETLNMFKKLADFLPQSESASRRQLLGYKGREPEMSCHFTSE